MFWDKVASLYDFFETVYNKKVYTTLGERVAMLVHPDDSVLECACGTGAITVAVGRKCRRVTATDHSDGMLRQVKKKCAALGNVTIEKADIMQLPYDSDTFDAVIAGNVIHLLNDPKGAIKELERVCRTGGRIILPTYVDIARKGHKNLMVKFLQFIGINFKRQFDADSYREFFEQLGYSNVEYSMVKGRMPCAIAVIKTNGND